jgi:hypothetical protein
MVEISLLKIIITFTLVVILIIASAGIAKMLRGKYQNYNMRGNFRLQEQFVIDMKNKLVLISYQNKNYMLLISPHSSSLVDIIDESGNQ